MPLVPLLVLALALMPAPTPSPNTALLGQWESAVRTPEGVGNILQFYPDGRVTQISASMAEADYRLVGDRLITTWKDLATGKISDVETQVEFEGSDRFVERSDVDNSGDSWSERIGDAPRQGSPLVGRWCFLFLETLTSYREFTKDRMYNRLPVVALRGTYSVSGDRLTVTMTGQPSGEYPFRIEGNELVIKSRSGEDRRYKRPETTLLQGY
jgi:hypothetical protein